MGRFYPVSCARSVAEQKFIRAKLDLWKKLPDAERNGITALICEIARGSVERAALETVLIRNVSPRIAAERYRLDKHRMYEMQRQFLDEVRLWP